MSDKHEAAALSSPEGRSSVVSSFFLSFLDAERCWQLFIAFPWSSNGSNMKLIPSLKCAQLLGWFWITAVELTSVLLMSPYCYLTNQLIKVESLKLSDDRLRNKVLWLLFGYCLKNWKWKMALCRDITMYTSSWYNFHSNIKLWAHYEQLWITYLLEKEEKDRKQQGTPLWHKIWCCFSFNLLLYELF